nr:immunoglobulin light chain junction region [Macaca mulatta]
CQQYNCAPWTF